MSDRDEYLKWRAEHFAVEVRPSYGDKEERTLSVTHNGYQWNGISLLPDEMRAVVKALLKELGEHE